MLSGLRRHVRLASIFGCLFLFSPLSLAVGEAELGRVVYARDANLRGMPTSGSETILSGDVLTTSEEGSALVELKSGAKLKTEKGSSVRFLSEGETVQAELLSGTVVSDSAGKPTMVVTTPKYQFAPAQEEECRYVVQLSKEQAIVAGAMKGNILVKARNATGSYILHQGNYAAISAAAAGVPGQATEASAQTDAQRVGTVSDVVPDGVVQRKGQVAETTLKVNDGIYREDVVRTLQNGRLRIALSDGSSMSFGARSDMEFIAYDPRLQQTQIRLTAGEMRARVVKLIQEYSSFKVQTPTAAISVAGADFIVEAQANKTGVYCIDGMVSVQNIEPDIAELVVLHSGEYTSVAAGQPPSAAMSTPTPVLQSQISQTTVGSTAGGQKGQTTTPGGWHIGSLSEGASVGLIVGIGAGAAVAAAIPAMSHHSASPSAP